MKERKQSYFKKIGKSLPKIIDKNIKERNFVEVTLIKMPRYTKQGRKGNSFRARFKNGPLNKHNRFFLD